MGERALKVAVVGHVEWVQFGRVERLPRAGEVAHATDAFAEPAGGGAVAAVALARLAGGCLLVTALGADVLARQSVERLSALGVEVRDGPAASDELPAGAGPPPTRQAVTLVDAAGERTITTFGPRLDPAGEGWHDDAPSEPRTPDRGEGEGAALSGVRGGGDAGEGAASSGAPGGGVAGAASGSALPARALGALDAVYFTAGDLAALRRARAVARVLVASPRARHALGHGVALDALVLSADDEIELAAAGPALADAELVVYTEGAQGGRWRARDGAEGRWAAAPLPGPVVDAYGAGDTFAAALTYGLGAGMALDQALALAAERSAEVLTWAGPYGHEHPFPESRAVET